MWHRIVVAVLLLAAAVAARAAQPLVIDLDSDGDLVSLAHHVDGFLFAPTMNFSPDVAGDLGRRFRVEPLRNHLAATALVRIGGAVAGFATEHEVLSVDPATGGKRAESAWLIQLTLPGYRGFLAVTQVENAGPTFALVRQVMENPQGSWPDRFERFLSTSGDATVTTATGELLSYLGGRFEEYNFVNPADFARLGRFRGRIQFVVHPQ
ncbi:MAG: hypothetical protein FJ191_11540 [Gammaproteobacteria bacterium]|nr:hypothetical protein [Gammaproteobacteria bacterium]